MYSSNLYLLHGVHHEFVEVLVPLNGVLVLEVTAEGEHDVVGPEVAGLEENVTNERVYTLINVVVHQVRIVLGGRESGCF